MKTISVALQNHLRSTPTTLATMWKITRADGQVFAFTEHDRDITYLGLTYRSTGGFNKSAIKSSGSFATDNMEVNGFLSDDTIADDEMRNGAFDYAEVQIFLVNYNDLSMGELKLRYGNFGEVRTAPSGMFLVELRGLVDMLAVKIGDVYQPECRVDLGSTPCGIKLSPDEWQAKKTYKVGDRVIFAVNGGPVPRLRIGPVNGDYETGALSPWAGSFVGISQGTLNVDPLAGETYFARLGPASGGHRQTINLEQGFIDNTAISTGVLTLEVTGYGVALEYGSSVAMAVTYFPLANGSGTMISSETFEFGLLRPENVWRPLKATFLIPPSAKSVAIQPFVSDITSFATIDVGLDKWDATIVTPRPSYTDYSIYGGIEFECTDPGVTGATPPTFNETIGGTTVDSGVVWTARLPDHMFLGEVASNAVVAEQIIGTSNFGKPTGWFDWGVVRFLSGANIGRSVECVGFNASLKRFILALPMPFKAEAGDLFTVHTGCDKSRGICFSKFDNIINFRGEPDVPGLSQYFRVAGMGR